MNIINTKFEKIKNLIDVFVPDQNNQPDYLRIMSNIRNHINEVQRNAHDNIIHPIIHVNI